MECQWPAGVRIAHWHSRSRSANVRFACCSSARVVELRRNPPREITAAAVLRIVLVVLATALAVLLIYELRRPLTYLFVAGFLSIALARPVAFFERRMRRGFAIAVVYLLLIGIPVGLGALLIPPIVRSVADFANNVPHYVDDAKNFVNKNKTLRHLDRQYDITGKIEKEAGKLPGKAGAAASTLASIGGTLVSGIFALVTILILTAFLLGSGARWYEGFIALQPADRRDRLRRVLDDSAGAISGYVAGALLQATVAGVTALVVLEILGVPFATALALIMGLFDLIPVIGATIGAVIIGVFTLFADFPTATIVWVVYSVVYQQFENSVIQPQIQKRTVNVNGFIIVVAVLFGSTLFGILGALTAIPIAASIQIAIREWWEYRAEQRAGVSAVSTAGEPGGGGAGATTT
jgi:predicted PurR-regulated permease PerM